MSYIATDLDLPPIFWPEGQAPEPVQRSYDEELHRFVHICVQYPGYTQSQLDEQQRKAAQRAQQIIRKEAKENRKVFVKGAKAGRMAAWLDAMALQECATRMNTWEQQFFMDQYVKFKRYFPAVKWVTQKQYDVVESLAMRFLK